MGVARNGKYRRLVYPPEPVFFQPLYQCYRDLVTIHARVSGDPQGYAAEVERTVHELNADLPVFGVTTLKSSMQLGSIFERLAGTFAGAFGFLALVLAAVGIYGVIAYTTRQRTREIAIRMALGAQRAEVLRLVLGQGLWMTLTGLAVGHCDITGTYTLPQKPALWGHQQRPVDLCGGDISAVLGVARCLLRPRAPGDQGRSHGGAEV